MRRASTKTLHKTQSGSRHVHRLMDEIYREMFLLEAGRPGAEMALALALLRARVTADGSSEKVKNWNWLKTVSPICLEMIEASLAERSKCSLNLS